MKGIKNILIYLILMFLSINLYSQVLISEGFEGTTSIHTPPTNWIPDSNEDFWYFQNGGWDQFTGYHHPANAHTGNYNAMFKTFGTATSKLVLPAIDLRYSIKPVLTFWNAQESRAGINDKLKVYYRKTSTSSWIELDNFVNPTSGWVKREIILPDDAKTQTCQLAFDGSSQNLSWGTCIDDIVLEEKGNLPRQVESLSLIQLNNFIPTKSKTNPLGIINVNVSGNTGNQTLKSISITYSGTNISDIDINNSEIFYTRDTIFSSKTKLIPTISPSGNTITFSNLNYNFQTGENYIWICAAINSSATHNNIADFKILQNSINISDINYPSTTLDPSNYSIIEESVLYDGFESSSGWQYSTGSCWQMGIPTGTGANDPDFAYSGLNVLATNLTGNYPAGIRPSNPNFITTPLINAKYYQNLNIRFKRWLNFEFFDKTSIQCSVDGGTTWTKIWENNTTIQDQSWKNLKYTISQATRKENVKIRISIDSTDLTGLFGGWNIDNFAITGDFIAKDVGVSSVSSPYIHCGMGAETVTVTIKNYGGATISGPFEVGFSLDNGSTYTKETINPTIPSEGTYNYTFTNTANLSSYGLKQLAFKTFLTGDEDASNDKFSKTLYVFPSYNYLYSNSFETTNGYWYPSGTNSTWAWGIPSKATINKASDGTKVWVTGGLKNNYAISEFSYLESPCFNFTNAEYPVFSFDYLINTENNIDGLRLEYSTNDGATWDSVPKNLNHNLNWCTKNVSALSSVGWSGNSGTSYVTAKTLLPTSIIGKDKVKFRFVFASDDNNVLEGMAIDNIKIYELPYDVGIKRLVTPISGCYIGNNVKLTAKIKNIGYRPLKSGLKVPIEIKLRTENVVKDTLVVGSLVAQNDSISFTTTGTYNIFTKGSHSLRLNTNFTPELNRVNDTLKTTLQVRGIPGYTLGPDKAVTIAQRDAGVELDAGLNGAVEYNSYAWVPSGTTRKITVTSFGEYSVTVTNENGCTAKDTIEVVESTSDVSILSATGLSDACQYPTPVYPTITIKNIGPNPVGPSSSTTKSIPLSIMVNDTVRISEIFTPISDIGVGATADYTFVNSLSLLTPSTDSIKIYSKINEDPEKINDTLKLGIHVWGMPNVYFPYDSIVTLQADSIDLDAGSGFATYTWQNNSHNQTFSISSLTSAWYKVTVTDIHACGSDKDSVYVNAKDLEVISIQNPAPSFCDNTYPKVSVLVGNSGRDNFAVGEKINLTYTTPNETVSKEYSLTTPLNTGASLEISFDNPVELPSGEGFINILATIPNDRISNNNYLERTFEKRVSPTVTFNPSTISRVFDNNPYAISPVYSNNVKSFAWQSPLLTNVGYDSLYTIIGTPPGRNLYVFAYEALGQIGCSDTAMLTINADDLAVSSIKSPTNRCEFLSNTPVIITIENRGNFTYPTNTPINFNIYVDGTLTLTETKNLPTDLIPGASRDFTLTGTIDLSSKSSASITATISTTIDVVDVNNSLNRTIYATGYPTVNIGSSRSIHAWSDTLSTGTNFNLYSWMLNGSVVGSDSILIANQTGNYKVSVTDYNGCQATSNEITLTFVVDDIFLKSLDTPTTGCDLSSAEPVRVTIENTGTETVSNGTSIQIGFKQNGVIKNENLILSSVLLSGQTRSFDLLGTMDFTSKTTYPIKVWAKMSIDMQPNNDTLATSITAYPPVIYNNFITDTIETANPNTTLDAGAGFVSYLWNTNATTQTINVTTSGDYWVEVSNSNGCKGRDSVYVKFLHDIAVDSLITPQTPACSLTATETVTVRLKNEGTNSIPNGTSIQVKLYIASTLVATENCVLTSDLAIGSTKDYQFIYKPDLSSTGDHIIQITANLKSDNNTDNNSITKDVFVYGFVAPNLGADRVITVATVLDAGAGYSSYAWSTGATSQTITVSASGTYSVAVTDANGCSGSDEVTLTWQEQSDVRVTELTTPSTNCFSAQGQTVTVKLSNLGSRTFNTNESINVSYQVGSNTPVVETHLFTSSFAYGQTVSHEFTQKALIDPGAVTMYCKTIISGNDGQIASFPVTINSLPVFSFSSDTIRVPGSNINGYVLASGINGVNYTWSTGSHNPSITLTTYGSYWLEVTNSSTGCSKRDTVVVTWPVTAETIPGSNAKVSLFPNPVNDELTIKIETDKNEAFTIDFVSPQGQTLKTLKTNSVLSFSDKINVGSYTPGIYFIKVSNDKGSAVFKVIVKK